MAQLDSASDSDVSGPIRSEPAQPLAISGFQPMQRKISSAVDYYLTTILKNSTSPQVHTVLKDTKKTGSHCGAMASRFASFFLDICAKLLKSLGHQGFSVDGLITPTLKAAGSNPVGRTKTHHSICGGF